jgi:SOS response regulatory protein OraA/RecX
MVFVAATAAAAKGIDAEIIDAALADLDADEAAYDAAKSQVRRLRAGITRQDFHKKVSTLLQRRGFSYGVARSTLRRLMQEIDAENPEFFGSDENESNEPDEADMID